MPEAACKMTKHDKNPNEVFTLDEFYVYYS